MGIPELSSSKDVRKCYCFSGQQFLVSYIASKRTFHVVADSDMDAVLNWEKVVRQYGKCDLRPTASGKVDTRKCFGI